MDNNSEANIDWKAVYAAYLSDPKSSYQKIADMFHIASHVVEYMGKKYDWPARKKAFLQNVYKAIEKEAIDAIVAHHKKLIASGQLASSKAMEKLIDSNFEPTTPKDVLSYLVKGLQLEGLGLGFVPADKQKTSRH